MGLPRTVCVFVCEVATEKRGKKEVQLRSRRAQYIYDRNYNRIGYIATQSSVFLLICTKQTSGEEVKTSVTQKEKTKGICMDHFLLFLRIHN